MFPKRHKVLFLEGDDAELVEVAKDIFCCPVCGFPGVDLMYPIAEKREAWDFMICPSCLTEYSADDQVSAEDIASGIDHVERWRRLREKWLVKVDDKNAAREQLKRIGIYL